MTYEEFKKDLYRNLRQQEKSQRQVLLLEKGSVLVRPEVVTLVRLINLGDYGREETVVREDTICVVWRRHDIVHMLHWRIRPIYEQFKREGWQGVLPEMVSKIQRTDCSSAYSAMSEGLIGREGITESERLIIRPMQYPYYQEVLEDGIYWRFGDIALALYLMVGDSEDEFLTVKINRQMAKKWDETDETLLSNALLNTYVRMPPRLYYGTDSRSSYVKKYGVFMQGEQGKRIAIHPYNEREGLHGYVLTTTRWMYGAVALFYPGVKERLAELLDGDYYVGFTSMNEVAVYPARHKVLRELKAAIQRTNILFDRREVLTDRVYRYSCSRKELLEV